MNEQRRSATAWMRSLCRAPPTGLTCYGVRAGKRLGRPSVGVGLYGGTAAKLPLSGRAL
jgi:hypothetical protein